MHHILGLWNLLVFRVEVRIKDTSNLHNEDQKSASCRTVTHSKVVGFRSKNDLQRVYVCSHLLPAV